MANIVNIWVHGSAMNIEYPERLESYRPTAAYFMVNGKSGTSNWFHYSISTPTTINDEMVGVGSVFIRFRTGADNVIVKDVHLYDGEFKIFEFNDLDLAPSEFETFRFDPPLLKLNYGLGISLHVEFKNNQSTRMDLAGAGAVLVTLNNGNENDTKTSDTTTTRRTRKARSRRR